MRPGRGQIVSAAGCRTREPQRRAVGTGDDLHHPMLAVLYRVVRLIRADAADEDQGAVNDDVVAFTEADKGFMKAGCPAGQDVQGLVDVAPGGGLRYPETRSQLGECLVLPQMDQREQSLLEAPEPAPAGVTGLAMLVQQPGNMLNQLMRDIEHGRIRKPSGPLRSPV